MLSRTEFLSLVLPPLEEGENYCSWGNSGLDSAKFEQKFVSSIEELCTVSDGLQAKQYNAFFGVAKFGLAEHGRFAKNAVALKSFFIDLDCGDGKPYPDLNAGLLDTKRFCLVTGLPKPTIVKSGRGAHLYWVLDTAIDRQQWKPYAERLKELCTENKFDVDMAVPADAARILRMPESLHLKDVNNPIPVEVMYVAKAIPLADIEGILAPSDNIMKMLEKAEFKRPMDAVTLALMGSSQSRFKTILIKSLEGTGCNQIKAAYEEQESLPEPRWRAWLSIAERCVDRNKAIHIMGSKHPDYNFEESSGKAQDTLGPYTCETFKKDNPSGCEGCTLKITSPIQLGKEIVEAEPEEVVMDIEKTTLELKSYTIPQYPYPFFRGKGGGIYVHRKAKDDDEEEDALVYPYDFYVVKRMQDPDHGETLLFRLHLPKDGVREFIMPLAAVLAKDRFRDTIAGHGVAVLGKKQDELMGYVTKWVEQLQLTSEAEKAHKQFGWIEGDGAIIVGDREIRATEVVYSPPSSPTLPIVPFFQPKGDFHVWKDVINSYGREGMENRAFGFFMGFGSLLMKYTNLDGFLLNLLSRESGSGKTTVLHAINSIYGKPKELLMSPKDTYNFRMQRFGTMQSLCATMDEITNMPAEQMSNQVYDITSGKGKNRMKQHENAERLNHSKWSLGLVTTSNRSITDSLLSIKSFPEGELMRILEIQVKAEDADATWSKQHFGKLMNNYGHAIEPYAQALVGQLPMVIAQMQNMQERVDRAAEIKNTERYWSAMATIAITGGAIAGQLGLHDIPVKPVFDYAIKLIKETRNRNKEYMFDNDEYLGGFLQRHFHEILTINGNRDARNGLEHGPIREPRGALTARYEPDTKLLYVVVKSYRDDCAKNFMNFEESLAQYRKSGGLLGTKKKRMTAGTVANTQAPVNALCFDTTKLDFFNENILLNAEDNERASPDSMGEV